MTKHPIHNVRHHAQRHHEAHKSLKKLLKRPVYRENVWGVFFATFLITIATIVIFLSWGDIANFFVSGEKNISMQVHGYKTGILSNYKLDIQAEDSYEKYLAQIPTNGQLIGLNTVQLVGDQPIIKGPPGMEIKTDKEETKTHVLNALGNSIWVTNTLSTGQHLTKMDQKKAKSFQKSILTTYYLGEKTIDINSTLQSNSQILTQINNALSVDLFQFLNQSANRADTLTNYINLLTVLLEKCNERIVDLQYKIDFLRGNSVSKETQIKLSEDAFFSNLSMFHGDNAEDELGKFIGLQQSQTEIKAKIGAYESLQGYYKFFQPKLDNLITAIKANRATLIAGVKVVEIQNMTLPLIIRQK